MAICSVPFQFHQYIFKTEILDPDRDKTLTPVFDHGNKDSHSLSNTKEARFNCRLHRRNKSDEQILKKAQLFF